MLLGFLIVLALLWLVSKAWVIVPWIGRVTGITDIMVARGLITGNDVSDPLVTMATLIVIPAFLGGVVLIGYLIIHIGITTFLTGFGGKKAAGRK